ncbi:hypothetical protein [Priestia endophytica]|uniref:hypothetical protein n=1 Tax=Priestia endophytica TaxID=135735 RepID=UPI00124F47D9|nr:hypothetical protein [Priestia endophytica]KAB2492289.1 hypothetical protein F8155_17510 [Priestia endophytica]
MQNEMNEQSTNQSQPMFMEPPKVISTKDALYIADMLTWNLVAMKKAHFFASHCQDAEIAQEIEKVCKMHQRHYERILPHLENTQSQQILQ